MKSPFPLSIVLSVFAAMTCIVGGDVAGKVLTQAGHAPFFVAWARFALGALVVFPFMAIRRAELRALADWRLILRAALIAAGITCILTALRIEPIANVFAAFFVGPIVSFILSAVLLREPVTALRAGLLAVSFAGVLIVVRPGFGMTAGMGWAVLAGCFYGVYLVTTRWLAPAYRPRLLLWSQLVIGGILLLPLGLSEVPDLTPWAGGLLLASAVGSATGNLLLALVNRTTPAGVVAPLIYSQLVAATAMGWLVFGDWPDQWVLIGLVLILTAGAGSAWAAGRGR